MVAARSILAALLLSAPAALAWGPEAIEEMMDGLIATSSGGTVVERALQHPNISAIFDAAQGLGYDGTNVLTWTDAAFGNVGTATGTLQRAYYEADTFGGYGAVVFSGAQAFNLSAALEMSNSSTIVIGYRASSANIFCPLGRSDVAGSPHGVELYHNNTAYYHPGVTTTGMTASSTWAWTNYLCLTGSNDGGPTTTNSYQIRLGGTNKSNSKYVTAAAGTTVNRIGGHKTDRTVGKITLILHFHPELTPSEMAEFESLAIEERLPQ